jgi:hypothetical protein
VKVNVLEVWDAEMMWCELWSRGESFTFLITIGTFIIIRLPLPQTVLSKRRVSKALHEELLIRITFRPSRSGVLVVTVGFKVPPN